MNCKPGQLAIVVYTPNGDGIGMIVEVLRGWGEFSEFGYLWTVRAPRPIRVTDEKGRNPKMKNEMQCPDAWLRPVSGLPIDEETREELTA